MTEDRTSDSRNGKLGQSSDRLLSSCFVSCTATDHAGIRLTIAFYLKTKLGVGGMAGGGGWRRRDCGLISPVPLTSTQESVVLLFFCCCCDQVRCFIHIHLQYITFNTLQSYCVMSVSTQSVCVDPWLLRTLEWVGEGWGGRRQDFGLTSPVHLTSAQESVVFCCCCC